MNYFLLIGAAIYTAVAVAIFAMCTPHRRSMWWLPTPLWRIALRCAVWPLVIVIGIWTDFIAPRWN